MVMELVFNAALLLFCGYAFYYISATTPGSTPTELGAAFWPHIILVLLMLLIAVNIYNLVKEAKAEEDGKGFNFDKEAFAGFFKSKLFVGMLLVAAMALLMDTLGFMLTAALFLMAYGCLLGERSPVKLILTGIIATIILYIIFQGALDIMLPRGIGFLRTFALWVETILPF